VGVGQKYPNLKELSVSTVVHALLSWSIKPIKSWSNKTLKNIFNLYFYHSNHIQTLPIDLSHLIIIFSIECSRST
jgi:hypothetical protein